MRHHAILVTCYDVAGIEEVREVAATIFGARVSVAVESPVNGYQTIMVAPDGSKEFWPDSDRGDAERGSFVAWLRSQAYEDGSNRFCWVEVQYGDENGDDRVLGSSEVDKLRARVKQLEGKR